VKENLINEFRDELHRLGAWWSANALDEENGGFVGEIDVNNQRRKNAEKGIILNSRILWFFSEVCRFTGNAEYKTLATKAYEYICNYFYDSEHGGVFWALDASGQCLNDRKQVYAPAYTGGLHHIVSCRAFPGGRKSDEAMFAVFPRLYY